MNPHGWVKTLLTFLWKDPGLQKSVALGVCLYGSCQRVREFCVVFQPGDVAYNPNQAAKGSGKMKALTKQRMEAREWPAPRLPAKGLRDTAFPGKQPGTCPRRHTHGRGAANLSTCQDTSVCPGPGASLVSNTGHLLEKTCMKSAKISKTLPRQDELLPQPLLLFHSGEQEGSMHNSVLHPSVN